MRRTSMFVIVVALIDLRRWASRYAQQIFSGFYGYTPPRWPTANTFKGAFNMCRVMFTSNGARSVGGTPIIPAPTSTSASGFQS